MEIFFFLTLKRLDKNKRKQRKQIKTNLTNKNKPLVSGGSWKEMRKNEKELHPEMRKNHSREIYSHSSVCISQKTLKIFNFFVEHAQSI